jgi:hypothetical protein
MKPFRKYGWKGTYNIDELNKIPLSHKMSFIMNLSPSYKKGTHWVAVYIDTKNDKSVEYYDSYGEDPPLEFMRNIKTLINKLHPEYYLKFKINKIVDQRANSQTCGYHCINFLLDRYKGKPFKDCTGYSEIMKSEKKADELKEKFKKFGLI